MFYADDGSLLANDTCDLHKLCAVLDLFCRRSGMRVNVAPGKTEMMIFGVSDERRIALKAANSFHLGGQPVRYTHQYTYLGCLLHEKTYFQPDFAKRKSQMFVKTLALRRALDHLNAARSLSLGFRLYDVQVRPSALYGSCVWGTRYTTSDPQSAHVFNGAEKRHLAFIRSWCHLRGHEPKWLVYRHLGRLPLHYFWWRDIVRFFNALHRLPVDSIWRKMMIDSEVHGQTQSGKSCWAGHITTFLRNVGYRGLTTPRQRIDEDIVLACLLRQYDAVWHGLDLGPRQPGGRTRFATYYHWLDSGHWLRRPKYLLADLPAPATCTYMRFMLGSHSLGVNEGRWQDARPQADRICRRCAMHCIDDERHLVFECPQLQYIREQWPELFSEQARSGMKAFFNQEDKLSVCRFVLQCLREYEKLASGDPAEVVVICDEWPDDYDSD